MVKKLIVMLVMCVAVGCSRGEGRVVGPSARMIVRTANVRVLVADTVETVDAVTKSVEGVGGFVSDSNIWREGDLLRARITLRVPADKLTSTLASIRGLAKRVESETITSEEVSAEFVDLTSL